MSFMNVLSSLAGQSGAGQPSQEQHSSIAQALMQHFGSQPGGLTGLADQFRQNGMGQHVDSWMSTQPGEQPRSIEPQQVEQGMGPEGVQAVAQRAGVNPELAKLALAAALPMLMSHLSQGSGRLPEQASTGGGLAGLAQSLFSRGL